MTSIEMLNIAQALAVAKSNEFMSREHAGSIWKALLKKEGFDDLISKKEEAVEKKKKTAN